MDDFGEDDVYERIEKAVYEELPCGSKPTERENPYEDPQWGRCTMEDASKDNEYDIIEMHGKSNIPG